MALNRPVRPALLAVLAILVLAGPAVARDDEGANSAALPAEAAYAGATGAADLTFPLDAEAADQLTSPRMALLMPAGAGPFPAIVLMHQCSGLNRAVVAWAHKAVARGYVVLLMDSLGPRGVTTVCQGPKGGVTFLRGARDALQAAQHLRRQPFVDHDRIALVGFSWGAMVGLLASSSHYVEALKAGPGFAAVASFYPGCIRIEPNEAPAYEILNADIARPVLVLMGGADVETPAADCLQQLPQIKAAGAPIEWHLYPGAPHCWDCAVLDDRSKADLSGNEAEYRLRLEVTEDSERRLFSFLDRTMPRHKR